MYVLHLQRIIKDVTRIFAFKRDTVNRIYVKLNCYPTGCQLGLNICCQNKLLSRDIKIDHYKQ